MFHVIGMVHQLAPAAKDQNFGNGQRTIGIIEKIIYFIVVGCEGIWNLLFQFFRWNATLDLDDNVRGEWATIEVDSFKAVSVIACSSRFMGEGKAVFIDISAIDAPSYIGDVAVDPRCIDLQGASFINSALWAPLKGKGVGRSKHLNQEW